MALGACRSIPGWGEGRTRGGTNFKINQLSKWKHQKCAHHLVQRPVCHPLTCTYIMVGDTLRGGDTPRGICQPHLVGHPVHSLRFCPVQQTYNLKKYVTDHGFVWYRRLRKSLWMIGKAPNNAFLGRPPNTLDTYNSTWFQSNFTELFIRWKELRVCTEYL